MRWWPRFFGKSSKPADVADRFCCSFGLTPDGKAALHVFEHAVPNGPDKVPCWVFVTSGFLSVGQKEFLFLLRQDPSLDQGQLFEGPSRFFQWVYGLAAEGRLVEAGDCSCFQFPEGFLGTTDQTGFAYESAEAFGGDVLPRVDLRAFPEKIRNNLLPRLPSLNEALVAILLTAEEAAVIPSSGCYRLLTLLGKANRYYPCPLWSNRYRASVSSPQDFAQSILSQMPRGHFRGATVRTLLDPMAPLGAGGPDRAVSWSGGRITLQLPTHHRPRLREELAQVPEAGSCALLTDPDPEANGRLVWGPGQQRTETIAPHWSDGSCMTGGFLALAWGGTYQDGGRVLEDGFLVTLGPASWDRVKDALMTGKGIAVPASDPEQMGFTLEWLPPDNPRQARSPGDVPPESAPAFDFRQTFLYQPDEVLRKRVASIRVVSRYVNRINDVAADHWATRPRGPGQAMTIVVALKPKGRSRFWLEFSPGGLGDTGTSDLLQRLHELPAPLVRGGPVALAIHAMLWGGPDSPDCKWVLIPKEWQEACRQRELLVPDGILDIVWPD